jgi:hypothetical protein
MIAVACLQIDVDVKIPCPLTTVEVYDQKASHLIDIHRKLEFVRRGSMTTQI